MLDVALTSQALADCSIEHQIVAAFDGFEGVTQLRAQEFDVVLLDLKMPKVDGFEVLEQIRRQPNLSNTPVIVLSNSVLKADQTRAEALGAVEFVRKALDVKMVSELEQTGLLAKLGLNDDYPSPDSVA